MDLLKSKVDGGTRVQVDYRVINGERRGEERRGRGEEASNYAKRYLTGKMSKVR